MNLCTEFGMESVRVADGRTLIPIITQFLISRSMTKVIWVTWNGMISGGDHVGDLDSATV
jgi:uncharacterized transporter YbjL